MAVKRIIHGIRINQGRRFVEIDYQPNVSQNSVHIDLKDLLE
ncbi:MAG: hypothetical protein N3G21_06105 [Candidatus Hydrogenedentes bacterium]|nr:hypothetical protein [Candidatus Hydrogenedentota bacterium]